MIGNDVVDLLDIDADASTYSPRFDQRVFSRAECDGLRLSGDAPRARWMLWAAKEAAYKALKQARAETIFSPAAFEVCWTEPLSLTPTERVRCSGVVKSAGPEPSFSEQLSVDVEADTLRVHATAWREGELAPVFEVAMLPVATGIDEFSPSAFVRRRLARKLGAALGIPRARIGFDRRERVPIVLLDGRPASIEISLSHHGRFVACAWSPRGVRRARSLVRTDSRRKQEVRA